MAEAVDSLKLREACKYCGQVFGFVDTRSGQNVVTCKGCGRFQYNMPKRDRKLLELRHTYFKDRRPP